MKLKWIPFQCALRSSTWSLHARTYRKVMSIWDLNLGFEEEPKMVKLNVDLDDVIVGEAKTLLQKYKDMFAWSCKELIIIPPHIVQHRIDLESTIPPIHQVKYRMNLIYVTVVKYDLDKLLVVGFIALVEEATWLSLFVVVPKKWQASNLRGFLLTKCCHKEGPIPLTFHQKGPQHCCNSWDLFFLGWFFMLPLDYDSSKGVVQNNIHYQLGGFCLGCHAIQFEERPTHLPNSSKYDLQGILRYFHEIISGQLQCLQWSKYPFAKVTPLFWRVLQIQYQLKSQQMYVSGVFRSHFGIHYVTRKQVIESKEFFCDCQHATIENSKGHINFQWNGSILPMFHLKLYIHHRTHHQIITKNRNLCMYRGVSIGMGCNSITICGCTDTHHPQVGSRLSCSHRCFKLGS